MAVRKTQTENNKIYFCTFTCYNWLPLFEITNLYEKIFNWFDLLANKGNKILGFVIMPNHLHLLIYLTDNKINLNQIISNGKRFMAYEIIKRLKENENKELLDKLSNSVIERERKNGKLHNVFQPSFDSKICFNEAFILQKIEYMHHNPVSKKWNLVEDFRNYKYSSASFYELNEPGVYPVTNFREII